MSAPQQSGGDPARDAGNETGRARAVITDGLPSQLVDTDPDETTEWLESLDAVVDHAGRGRARYRRSYSSLPGNGASWSTGIVFT